MGNSLGGRRRIAKVMKIDGETLKLKTPVQVGEVVKDYPGFVLLESEAVKHLGIRAKPLEPQQELKPRKLYFLIELPKFPEEKVPRRVRSGIQMSAKDRLESLMLSKRSVSDISMMKSTRIMIDESEGRSDTGTMRVRMRLPKAEVAKLIEGSKNETEMAEKIMNLCKANSGNNDNVDEITPEGNGDLLLHQQAHWKPGLGSIRERSFKTREKRVGFLPIQDGEFV